ncbi:MAG: RNA polymerase sigma factor [Flavobacteriales bacterium]|nr:RNA polymerase sigma factor [Flavobacteriales bacterium]
MTALEFDYQVTNLQENLKNFAQSLTLNSDDAKDLLQDTILKAFRYKEKYADQTNLKAWLFTIMKNTFINNYRRKKRANTVLDQTEDYYHLNTAGPNSMESTESTLNAQVIQERINKLDEEYKVPFMKHFEGFKYKEIAKELNIPIGTVKSRIFAARKKLSKDLAEFA